MRLLRLSRRLGGGHRDCPTGAAALEELCRLGPGSYAAGDTGQYVPFCAALVAEPAAGSPEIDMLSVLPQPLREAYTGSALWHENWRETALSRSRCFRRTLGPRTEYLKYLWRPEVEALWELAPAGDTLATCSIAAVP